MEDLTKQQISELEMLTAILKHKLIKPALKQEARGLGTIAQEELQRVNAVIGSEIDRIDEQL